jgi:hypothetical protein
MKLSKKALSEIQTREANHAAFATAENAAHRAEVVSAADAERQMELSRTVRLAVDGKVKTEGFTVLPLPYAPKTGIETKEGSVNVRHKEGTGTDDRMAVGEGSQAMTLDRAFLARSQKGWASSPEDLVIASGLKLTPSALRACGDDANKIWARKVSRAKSHIAWHVNGDAKRVPTAVEAAPGKFILNGAGILTVNEKLYGE